MFKSINDYDNAIYKVLILVRDTNAINNIPELDNIDLNDVVELCNKRGYITGIDISKNILGQVTFDGVPRITYSGLQFVENFNK